MSGRCAETADAGHIAFNYIFGHVTPPSCVRLPSGACTPCSAATQALPELGNFPIVVPAERQEGAERCKGAAAERLLETGQLGKRSAASLRQAVSYFEQAIGKDRTLAPAGAVRRPSRSPSRPVSPARKAG